MKIQQTLANTDNKTQTFFQTVCKLCIEYFCSSWKFKISVPSCSKNARLRVICFVSL